MLSIVWLSLFAAIGLYGISSYIKPLEGRRRDSQKLLAGILSLAYAALHLHAMYSILFARLPYAAISFRAVRWTVGGMLVSVLATLAYRQSAKTMLVISAVLFVSLPLGLVVFFHWASPGASFHRIFAFPIVYCAEALPIGVAIPAIVLLLQNSSENGIGQESAKRTPREGTEA